MYAVHNNTLHLVLTELWVKHFGGKEWEAEMADGGGGGGWMNKRGGVVCYLWRSLLQISFIALLHAICFVWVPDILGSWEDHFTTYNVIGYTIFGQTLGDMQ